MKTLPLKYKVLHLRIGTFYNLTTANGGVKFYDNIKNLDQINCFSNEGNKWRNSKIRFTEKNILEIEIEEKFVGKEAE